MTTRSFQTHQHAPEEEYYDAPGQEWDERERVGEERVLNERRISGSTSEMLRLDLPGVDMRTRGDVMPETENQSLRERKEELELKRRERERERVVVVRGSGYASPAARGPGGYATGYISGYTHAGRRVQVEG